MTERILITGATGNIGGEIVRQLRERGVDFAAGSSSGSVEGVESVPIDFGDKASLVTAMRGVSTVFMVLPNHPDMVKWGENIVDGAKESGVSHVVRSSGSLADIDSPLLVEKLLGTTDEYLRKSGLGYTITAPSFFMQNFINFFGDDYKKGAIYQPAGDAKIGWVDVRDIAAVNVEVLLNPERYRGRFLTITGGENLSYAEAVQQMNRVLGKETQYVGVPDEAAVEAMTGLGFPEFIIELMISLNRSVRQGHAEEVTDTVEQTIGRRPVAFSEFVEENRSAWL
jgi:NAD(P)H dehydrogenase (quinone)